MILRKTVVCNKCDKIEIINTVNITSIISTEKGGFIQSGKTYFKIVKRKIGKSKGFKKVLTFALMGNNRKFQGFVDIPLNLCLKE